MVIASVETSTSNSWSKQKPGQPTSPGKASTSAVKPQQEALLHPSNPPRIEEQPAQTGPDPFTRPDTEEALTTPGADNQELAATQHLGETPPDFTLDLSEAELTYDSEPATPITTSSTHKDPDTRPELPYTFNFGIRRPYALAVAMSQPLIGNQPPESPSQAIQQTFDLAATNRLPYEKGSKLAFAA